MAVLLLLLSPLPALSAIELGKDARVKLSADFRLRLESDWDSQNADGVTRDDRTRARVRARIGLTMQAAEGLEMAVRLRSGAEASHQSPHITVIDFSGNDTGAADFNLDKWYLTVTRERAWAWVGRNTVPFWRPHEIVCDSDATPAGLAAGHGWGWRESELTVSAGYLVLPVGMTAFSGNLTTLQAVFANQAAGVTVAIGYFGIDADPDDPDAARLINGNGLRDYATWIGNAQLKRRIGGLPLTLSGVYAHNSEGYSPDDPQPFTAANFDQTDGWLLAVRAGSLSERGDWLGGYHYARIETLAVNASYAQDDWVRWGSAGQGRATNMKGHELRLAYAFSPVANLVARLFIVDSITTVEDGNRLRLDFNFKF